MINQLVDNKTYNIITSLAKNLEACEVYDKYARDGNRELWNQLKQGAEQNVQILQQELMKTMGIGQKSDQTQMNGNNTNGNTAGNNNAGINNAGGTKSYDPSDSANWNSEDTSESENNDEKSRAQTGVKNDYISHNKTGQDSGSYVSHDNDRQAGQSNNNQ